MESLLTRIEGPLSDERKNSGVVEQRCRVGLPSPEHLHARYAAKIGRRVQSVMGTDDERDDLVQEVLIIILKRIGTLRDPACLDAWVFQITNNVLRQTLRQRGRRRQTFRVGFVDDESPLFQTNVEAREIASRVISLMERLSPNDRALLLSHWFTPGTLQSLADKSGCSVMTVQRRLNRARSRFEKLMRRDRALGGYFEALRQVEGTRGSAPDCVEDSAA